MHTYQVPVIVTCNVEVDDDGTARVTEAYTDQEGGPWAFSSDGAAFDTESFDWHEQFDWFSGEPWAIAEEHAYGALQVSFHN